MNGQVFRTAIRRIWLAYLVPGMILAVFRAASVFTWIIWHSFYFTADVGGKEVSTWGMSMYGVLSIFSAALLWPMTVATYITGKASLAECLFFPWVV